MIRLSDKSDSEIAEMKLLWKEYFGDSDEFIDFYFEKICARNKIVIMREDGILTGMLHLNPYIFSADRKEIIRTYYVVGVMVREGYRNQRRCSIMRIRCLVRNVSSSSISGLQMKHITVVSVSALSRRWLT